MSVSVINDISLSVILPNYNHAHYVAGALESIRCQSFQPLEVIVVDDCSTDNSVEVIEQLMERYPRVRLLRNDQNMGAMRTVNSRLKEANGEFVYFMAADDRILPGFFEKSVNSLKQYPQAGLCSTDMGYMDKEGNVINEYRALELPQASYLAPAEVLSELYKQSGYIIGVTTIFRRSALDEVGGFPPQLLSACDWFVELAIALKYGACYIPEVLCLWRLTESQYSATCYRDPWQMLEVVDQAVELMQSPRYRDVFPQEFVEFWVNRFGHQVINDALEGLTDRQYAFMEQLGRCVKPSGLVNRLLRRTLWSMTRSTLSFSKSSLRRRLRPIQRRSAARLDNKND